MALIWANGQLTTTAFEAGTRYALPRNRVLSLVTGISQPFVTLSEMKAHLRIEDSVTAGDAEISTLAYAATAQVMRWTGRSPQSSTWKLQIDGPVESVVELPMAAPIVSVSFITTYDTDNTGTIFDNTKYTTDTASSPARVFLNDGATWPGNIRSVAGWVCQYTCGYGAAGSSTTAGLRERFGLAVKMLAAHWYENREATSEIEYKNVPISVKAMVDGLKIIRI